MIKITVFCAIIAACSASYIGARRDYGYGASIVRKAYAGPAVQNAYVAPVVQRAYVDPVGPPTPYQMGYEIVDEKGNKHGRKESGDAAGNKVGSYNLALADGRQRIVDYTADDYGFRAVVRSNEPGTDPSQDPADVVQEPLGYAKVAAPYVAKKAVIVGPAPSYGYGAVAGYGSAGYGPRHGGYAHGGYSRGFNRRASHARPGFGRLARY